MKRDSVGMGTLILLAIGLVGLSACSTGTQPDVKPTSVRVRVEGTAPVPLQLVVSTDFYEIPDDITFEPLQVIEQADTFFIDLPYDATIALTKLGSVVVALTNFDTVAAQVRLRVDLDSGQAPYDQSATMSLGGTLRYVFSFTSIVF